MKYAWKVGDVFTNGQYRWRVAEVSGDRAILQSCTTKWARTIWLTVDEWMEGSGSDWRLEVAQ